MKLARLIVPLLFYIGLICHLANPWPQAQVKVTGSNTATVSGPILNLQTKAGDTLLLTPAP